MNTPHLDRCTSSKDHRRPPSSPGGFGVVVAVLVASAAIARAAEPANTNAPTAAAAAEDEGDWTDLFNGRSLSGWKVTDFAGHGEVEVKEGQLILPMGAMLTGVTYTNKVPGINYEVSLEAKRVSGSDFFCGLTVPVRDAHCTLIMGGWGGGIVGISSIDGYDASENETTKYLGFEKDRWYKIRLRVTPAKLQAWLDDDRIINQSIEDRRISMRAGEIELSVPFGIATYQTTGTLRNIRIRSVRGPVK